MRTALAVLAMGVLVIGAIAAPPATPKPSPAPPAKPQPQPSPAKPATPPPAPAPAPDELKLVTDLCRKTLELVERSAPRPALAAEFAAIEKRVDAAKDPAAKKSLYTEVRALRRKIILSHPALDFSTLLINKRSAQIPGHMCDQYLGRHAQRGPGLVLLDNWKDKPAEKVLLVGKLPAGSVLNPDLSFDGKRILFSYVDLSQPETRERQAYFIYEIGVDGSGLRQVTGTSSDAKAGEAGRKTVLTEDFDPCYLPDGGIAFISTRSQQFGRCHGARYVPSYVLYRADADGSNIKRLSQNEANEWDPQVLNDGRIIYCRWDYINRHDVIFQSLWTMRTDGTNTAHFYGNNSRQPCMITEARAIPGSDTIVATGTDHHGYTAGTVLLVDPRKGEDHGEPLTCVTPELPCPEGGLPPSTTMTPMPLPGDLAAAQSRGRRGATPYPLSENLFLMAYWHVNQYAIYLVDTLGGRELIYYDPAVSCWTPIPVRATTKPPVFPSLVAGKENEKTGRFVIQDVHMSRQPIAPGSVKYVRVNQIIPQPTRAKPTLSAVHNEIIKKTLGTVPVEPDGSVAFEAPANTPLQLQILDSNKMAVMTMRSLAYVQPGETVSCIGCHESRLATPKPYATNHANVRALTPPAGPNYDGGFSFMRTVQPVLDRYCIDCHGLNGKTEGKVDLLGSITTLEYPQLRGQPPATQPVVRHRAFPPSYRGLMDNGLVRIAQRNSESYPSAPKDYYSHAGRLSVLLLQGHKDAAGKPRLSLDRESFERIINWMDLNAQFYGDYSFNRLEQRPINTDGVKALRSAIAKRFGKELAQQPFEALVNVTLPPESRILKAPLAKEAGGWEQITNGWASTSDPDYREMARLVDACQLPTPYHDIDGTCGRDVGCVCGCCWVRLLGLKSYIAPGDVRRHIAAAPTTQPKPAVAPTTQPEAAVATPPAKATPLPAQSTPKTTPTKALPDFPEFRQP